MERRLLVQNRMDAFGQKLWRGNLRVGFAELGSFLQQLDGMGWEKRVRLPSVEPITALGIINEFLSWRLSSVPLGILRISVVKTLEHLRVKKPPERPAFGGGKER